MAEEKVSKKELRFKEKLKAMDDNTLKQYYYSEVQGRVTKLTTRQKLGNFFGALGIAVLGGIGLGAATFGIGVKVGSKNKDAAPAPDQAAPNTRQAQTLEEKFNRDRRNNPNLSSASMGVAILGATVSTVLATVKFNQKSRHNNVRKASWAKEEIERRAAKAGVQEQGMVM